MLPATNPPHGEISDVAENLLGALRGFPTPWGFPAVPKVALIVVDGLGLHNLLAKSGHARHLARGAIDGGLSLSSGLPSTTSAALASLTSGQKAGAHGLLGYTVLDPHSGGLLNHLKPFPEGVEPELWQPCPTIFETLSAEGVASLAVGEGRFEGTDFSRAVLRGAPFAPSRQLSDHLRLMREFFDQHERGLCYLYWPGLDRIGHAKGVDSAEWVDELEKLDAFVAEVDASLGGDEAAVVTADHGMVTVTESDRVVLMASDPLRAQIAHVGGEPRCVHLYAASDANTAELLAGVRGWVGERGDVFSRAELIEARIFGDVPPAHQPRIGDVVIFARDSWVFYDEATASKASYLMVGQHGSMTDVETTVPLVGLGAWRR